MAYNPGGITDTQIRATPLPVSGAVTVTSTTITGSVAVTGPLTDTQLRLTAVPVSLTSTTVTGSVAVTGPLTDTQLRVTPVPISGTVTTGGITDTQIRATALPVSLTSTTITGSVAITAAALPLPTGAATETTLAALNTKVTAVNTGAVTISAALPAGVNAIGTVAVGSNSLVSTANSTAVNLAAAAVFTGTSEDVSEYSTIAVTVFASHASATDGLSVQQSADGANWDNTDVYSIPAATGKIFSFGVAARFYRLVYTNGATLTTSLRIQTIHSKNAKKASSVRPSDARPNDNDFEEMSAFAHFYNGASWDRARGSIANGMAVDVTRLPATPTGANTIGAVTGPAAAALALDATLTGHTQRLQSTTLAVTVTAAANTAATATLPAVAAQFHYITGIEIIRTSTAALAGTATLVVTTSNLPGALAWSFGNAMAAGATQRDLLITFPNPIKSSVVNTATTVVMPAPGAAVLWRANIYYYTAA